MKARCNQPNDKRYQYYGARGIKVSEELSDFKAFYDYVISLPNAQEEGLSLDREDNDGNYVKGNLRWVNHHVQTANRNIHKTNKSGYNGVFKTYYNRYTSTIGVNLKRIYLGTFGTAKEAAIVRDNYIIENGLFEYQLQVLSRK